MDIARLGLEVRSDSVPTATRRLDRFSAEGRKAEGAAGRLEKSTGSLSSAYGKVAAAVGGAVAAIASINSALRGASQYQGMVNGLRGMGQSADQAAASLDAVGAIAQRTRAPLDATAQLYQRISIASGELGASQQEVLRFTENVGLALAASGTSAQEASGSLLQLSQAMSSGTVRAEEFNSILEGAFPIARAAARGIDEAGGSVGRLRSLVIEGKISSEEFFDAIISQTGALESAFANTVPTIGQAVTVLGSGLTMLIGKIDQAAGVTEGIASAIMGMGNAAFNASAFVTENMDAIGASINDVQGIVIAAAGALTASYIPAAYGAVAATAAWAASLVTLKGALVATGVGALIVGAGLVIGKFMDLVDATGSWGAALSALGGLAKGVWKGIQTSAAAIEPALGAIWKGVQADFLSAMSVIVDEWSRILSKMAGDAAAIPLIGDKISNSLSEAASNAAASMSEYDAKAQGAASASARLNEEAGALASEGWAEASEAAVTLRMLMDSNRDGTEDTTDETEKYNAALKDTAGAAGGAGAAISDAGKAASGAAKQVDDFADEIERLNDAADPMRKFNRELDHLNKLNETGQLTEGAYAEAFRDMNAEMVESTPLLAGVNDAFGQMVDYMFDGFKDGLKGIWNIFTDTLKRMAAAALKNKITISLGMAATGAGEASAGGAGGAGVNTLGNMAGLLGGGAGTFFGGIGAGFSAATGAGSAGLFAVSQNAATAVATGASAFSATIGAAIPVIGAVVGAGMLLKSAIGTTTKLTNAIEGRFELEGLTGGGEYDMKESDGWFSKGIEKNFEAWEGSWAEDIGRHADETFKNIAGQVRQSITDMGLEVQDFVHDFDFQFQEGSLEPGALYKVVEEEARKAGDAMLKAALEAAGLAREGETGAETLQILSQAMNTLNGTAMLLGGAMLESNAKAAGAARELIEMSGGLEEFNAKAQTVFENFLTDAEQLERAEEIANASMTAMEQQFGITLPETHAQFMDLLNAQDLTTAAGRETYAALLDVADEFVTVNGTAQEAAEGLTEFNVKGQKMKSLLMEEARLKGDTAYIREQEMAALTEAEQAVQQRIYNLQDEAQAARELAAIEREREGLLMQIARATGNVEYIRQQELLALDDSTRALQEHIYMLEDQVQAARDAKAANNELLSSLREQASGIRSAISEVESAIGISGETNPATELVDAQQAYDDALSALTAGIERERSKLEGQKDALLSAMFGAANILGETTNKIFDDMPDQTLAEKITTATQDYNDALSALAGKIASEKAEIESEIAALEGALGGAADALGIAFDRVAEPTLAEKITTATQAYETALADLAAGIERERAKLQGQIDGLTGAMAGASEALFGVVVGNLREDLTEAEQVAADIQGATQDYNDALAALAAGIERERSRLEGEISAMEGALAGAADALGLAFDRMDDPTLAQQVTTATQDYNDALSALASGIERERSRLTSEIDALESALAGAADALGRVFDRVADQTLAQQITAGTQAYDSALSALASGIDSERSAIESRISGLEGERDALTDALEGVADTMRDAARDIFGTMDEIAEVQRKQALAQLRRIAATGQVDPETVSQTVQSASNFDSSNFKTQEDLLFEQKVTANLMEDIADSDLSIQGQQLEGIQKQINLAQRELSALDDLEQEFGLAKEALTTGELASNVRDAEAALDALVSSGSEQLDSLDDQISSLGEIEKALTIGDLKKDVEKSKAALEGLFGDGTAELSNLDGQLDALGEIEKALTIGDLKDAVEKSKTALERLFSDGSSELVTLNEQMASLGEIEKALTVGELRDNVKATKESLDGLFDDGSTEITTLKGQLSTLEQMEKDFGLVKDELTIGELKNNVTDAKDTLKDLYEDGMEELKGVYLQLDVLKKMEEELGIVTGALTTDELFQNFETAKDELVAAREKAEEYHNELLAAIKDINTEITVIQGKNDDLDDIIDSGGSGGGSGISDDAAALLNTLDDIAGAGGATLLGEDAFGRFSEDGSNALLSNAGVAALSGTAQDVADAFADELGRNVDVSGLQFYVDELADAGFGLSDLASDLAGSTEALAGVIPGFAIPGVDTGGGGGSSSGGSSSGGSSSGGGGSSSGGSSSGGYSDPGIRPEDAFAKANGTDVFPKPDDWVGRIYGNNGVPISEAGYNFWKGLLDDGVPKSDIVNFDKDDGDPWNGFVAAAEAAGTYQSVPSYRAGTDYHPGGMARLHENEMVNLPRGTSVSTAGEVKEMVTLLKEQLDEAKEMNARMREQYAELRRQGQLERQKYSDSLETT